MKLAIWGCGIRGNRILRHLELHKIVCFIDGKEELWGTSFHGYPVMSLNECVNQYSGFHIVITQEDIRTIKLLKGILEERNIKDYFIYSDCPGDMLAPHITERTDEPMLTEPLRVPYQEFIEEKGLKNDTRIAIIGCNLFSINLYDILKDRYGIDVRFVSGVNVGLEEGIAQKDGGKYRFADEDWVDSADHILIADRKRAIKRKEEGLMPKEICVHSMMGLSKYRNPEIQKFKGIHTGEKCFIVAMGPSLRIEDLDMLAKKNIITFSMNRCYLAFDKTKWRPDYYLVSDAVGPMGIGEDIFKIDGCRAKFVTGIDKEFWIRYEKEIQEDSHINKWYACFDQIMDGNPEFSEDCEYGTFDVGSVVYSCIQFAAYMGFEEIYLIGADCTEFVDTSKGYFLKQYIDGVKYLKEEVHEEWIDLFVAYEKSKEYANQNNIKIYNATRGGALEIFKRVNIEDCI